MVRETLHRLTQIVRQTKYRHTQVVRETLHIQVVRQTLHKHTRGKTDNTQIHTSVDSQISDIHMW